MSGDYDINYDDLESDSFLSDNMYSLGSGTHAADFYSDDPMINKTITPDLRAQVMAMLSGTLGDTWDEICQYLSNSEKLRRTLWWSTYDDSTGWDRTTRRLRYRQRSAMQIRNKRWNEQHKALHGEYYEALLHSMDKERALDIVSAMTDRKLAEMDRKAFRGLAVAFTAAVTGTSKQYVRRMENKDGRAVALFAKALEEPSEGSDAALEVHKRAAGVLKDEFINKGYIRQIDS